MKYTRTFTANVGQTSTGTAGPDQIELDLDQIAKNLDPLQVGGGITSENLDVPNITEIVNKVTYKTNDIKYIRLNVDKVIEVSADNITWEATGSGGHLIIDSLGNVKTQRSRLKFLNVTITDDGTQTIITGVQGVQGLQGIQGIQGIQGVKGDNGADGRTFSVLGLYATLGALQTAHPVGSAGDAYAVGTSNSNYIHVWSVSGSEWEDIGQLQGPQGPQGSQGVEGVQGPQGIQGVAGVAGTSAYTAAVAAGYSGTESAFNASLSSTPAHLINETNHVQYVEATGSANTYIVALTPAPTSLVAGMAFAMKVSATNTGASTINPNTLGAIAIKDSKGNALSAGKLTINSIVTLRYNGTNFILQGEGASGTAIASHLLSGDTASVDAGQITGTMTNHGVVTFTPGTTDQPISEYYVAGSKVSGDADLVAGNIKGGADIFGVSGTFNNLKSVQYVSIAIPLNGTTGSVTISSVTPDNAAVVYLGHTIKATGVGMQSGTLARVGLSGATTVTATRNSSNADVTINVMILEFVSVKSKQSGIITIPDSTLSATATITAVTTAEALLFFCGVSSTSVNGYPCMIPYIILTNSTTITASLGVSGSGVISVGWNLIELN